MGNYRIKIEPLGMFYFGSERKFNPVESDRNNYLVHSRMFPQQTTLLGMLRFALLKKMVRVVDPQMEGKLLIGPNSFDEKATSYGIIQRLSPVYVSDEKDQLFVEAGLDYQMYKDDKTKKDTPLHLELKRLPENGVTGKAAGEGIYYYANYDPKKRNQHCLTSASTSDPLSRLLSLEEVFKPCQKPGNQKDRTGVSQEKGFYKQTMYRMEKGYSFVLFLETSQGLIIDDQPFQVSLGGDQSLFNVTLKVEEEDTFPMQPDRIEKGAGKVTLLSDAYISDPDEIRMHYYFANVEKTGFRYIKTILSETNNYADLYRRDGKADVSEKNKKPTISGMRMLVAKGSVFYCSDVDSFVSLLNHPAYRTIGYNQFKVTY